MRAGRRGEGGKGGDAGVQSSFFGFGGRVGEGFNFVRDYYFGFNSSFYGSLGIIMNRGVVGTSFKQGGVMKIGQIIGAS